MRKQLMSWVIILLPVCLFSQTAPLSDSGFAKRNADTAYQQFSRLLKENLPYYIGPAYTGHGHGIVGHAFYKTDAFQKGSLQYDGLWYQNVEFKFDLVDGTVLVMDYNRNFLVELKPEKIGGFEYMGERFIHPRFHDPSNEDVPNGILKVVFDGAASAFAYEYKRVLYEVTTEKTVYSYKSYSKYWVTIDDSWYQIKSKGQIIKLLSKKDPAIKSWAAASKLSFKKDPELYLASICSQYKPSLK
ncbi:MAG: hypothetical protein K2P88_10405 [Chitinophagaceae bacterium]|uniref:hypothetical protein n=1 Tax=unclassified Paraflavitalea TaxID=2798305 RepID=UPI003D3521FE|nr:hypothetical protein [Chitinophagaceae bacterium]